MREAVVSGSFYAEDSCSLHEQIKSCFLSEFGPGKLPGKLSKKEITGVICPHAGYAYSGPCAAYSYKAIAESKKPDVFIVLGTAHAGFGNSVSMEDWRTPLGIAKVDKEFAKILMKNGIEHNEAAQEGEHSIEVQIPFLQYILEDFKFIPILVSDLAVVSAIKKTIMQADKKVTFIASSDFTHYGANYGYAPFNADIKKNMQKLDAGAIDYIKKIDAKGFLDYIDKTGATICGRMPIAAMLDCIKAEKAELLKYYTSADISGKGYSMAVGYAAIKFS